MLSYKTTLTIAPVLAALVIALGVFWDTAQGSEPDVLLPSAMHFLGHFNLPFDIPGFQNHNISSTGGIAIRHVNGQKRFFLTGHVNDASPVYEVSFPGWGATLDSCPTAQVVNAWGNVWRNSAGVDLRDLSGGRIESYVMWWDEPNQRLINSYNYFYNTTGQSFPSLSWCTLGNPCIAHGLWDFDQGSNRTRGGVIKLPTWITSQIGHAWAVGFGGIYSGSAACSRGPGLYAFDFPSDSGGTTLGTTVMHHYEFDMSQRFCARPPDYYYDGQNDWWDRNPDSLGGQWSQADYMYQNLCYVETTNYYAFVALPTLGRGRLWYEDGVGQRADGGWLPEWYVFNPQELIQVALGQIPPNAPTPSYWASTGISDTPRGLCFDPTDNTLYVFDATAYPINAAPAVLGFRIDRYRPRSGTTGSWPVGIAPTSCSGAGNSCWW